MAPKQTHCTSPRLTLSWPRLLHSTLRAKRDSQTSLPGHLDLCPLLGFGLGSEIQARPVFTTAELLGTHRLGTGPRRRVPPTCSVCHVHLVQLQQALVDFLEVATFVTSSCPMMLSSPGCLAFHATLAPYMPPPKNGNSRKAQLTFRSGYPWSLCLPSFRLRTRPLELALWLCIAKVEAFQATRRPSSSPATSKALYGYSPSLADPSARSPVSLSAPPPWPHSCPWAFS